MYRGTSELILDTDSEEDELGDEDSNEDESLDADDKRERSDDEGHGLGDEDQDNHERAFRTCYGALRRHELALRGDQPTLDTWVDLEDGRVYTDIPTYVPLAALFRHYHILSGRLRLVVLPPTLVADIDRDVRKLYTRSGAVIDEIFSQSEEDELGDEDSKEDESLDADDKRERSDDEGHGLGDEDQGLDDESQGLEYKGLGLEEEAVLKGEQQAVLVV
nr:hypothetical protein [Tanacetum cinerariifolium]